MRVDLDVVHAAAVRGRDAGAGRLGHRAVRRRAGWWCRTTPPTAACGRTAPAGRCGCSRRSRATTSFDEACGTKALKPDLEAVVGPPGRPDPRARLGLDARADALRPARPRRTRPGRRPGAGLRRGSPSSSRSRPTSSTSRAPPWSATSLRWFQRGLPSAGAPSASVDVELDGLLAMASGAPAAVRVSGVRRYDLGTRGRRRARDHRRDRACRAAWCWSARRPRTRRRRTTTARWSAPRWPCSTATGWSTWSSSRCWTARWPRSRGWPWSGRRDDVLDLVAVVDADDPAVPSLLLELVVEP